MISLNIEKTLGFISKENVFAYESQVKAAQDALENGSGKGNDFLGWLHLPSSITQEHLADLKATAQVLRDNCEVVVVAGIGGATSVHVPLSRLCQTVSLGCKIRNPLRLFCMQDTTSVKIICTNLPNTCKIRNSVLSISPNQEPQLKRLWLSAC